VPEDDLGALSRLVVFSLRWSLRGLRFFDGKLARESLVDTLIFAPHVYDNPDPDFSN
jgi:hypothetical protein